MVGPPGHGMFTKALKRPKRARQYFIKNEPANAIGIVIGICKNHERMFRYAKRLTVRAMVGTGTRIANRTRLSSAIAESLSQLGHRYTVAASQTCRTWILLPQCGHDLMASRMPLNVEGQRWEPATGDVRTASRRAAWPPFAGQSGSNPFRSNRRMARYSRLPMKPVISLFWTGWQDGQDASGSRRRGA